MRVVVIGGSGHVGRLVLHELRGMDGVEALALSRPQVDLERPETFETLPEGAVLVDAASGPRTPPDALIDWALETGRRLVVTSADFGLFERVQRGRFAAPAPAGTALVGAGVYPGLSNLLAAEASRRVGGATALELHLAWSVLSAAGASTVDLMVEALRARAATWHDGALAYEEPFARRATSFGAWPMAFPETLMLPASTGARTVVTVATLEPAVPGFVLRLAARALRGEGVAASSLRALATLGLRFTRGVVLRGVGTGATISVRAYRGDETCALSLRARSAFEAAAAVIAFASASLARDSSPPRGLVFPEQCFSLEDVESRLGRTHPGLLSHRP